MKIYRGTLTADTVMHDLDTDDLHTVPAGSAVSVMFTEDSRWSLNYGPDMLPDGNATHWGYCSPDHVDLGEVIATVNEG